ncbi:MAG: hypothetical protein JWL77_5071 [Chthonomonadaceae bacterium]|nr:hypothetical protein [Chthonomonadaceae bacterium]
MQIADLAGLLLQRNQNVLFADTCTILDVIRSPIRSDMSVMETAFRISAEINAAGLPFSIVLPELFLKEWADNVKLVRDTLTNGLRGHTRLSGAVDRLHQSLHNTPLVIPDITSFGFEDALENLCNQIIASAEVVEGDFAKRAMDRAIYLRAPASTGKPEPKDCLIFETFLGLAAELRARGSTKRLVFVSSNTTDYGKASDLKPDIANDLALFNADFAASLDHGYYLASL